MEPHHMAEVRQPCPSRVYPALRWVILR